MRIRWSALALLFVLPLFAEDAPTRVRPEGKASDDRRLTQTITLDNHYFRFDPPKTREEWETRRTELRQQLLVAVGLWPMPEKTPLNPVIHGRIDRDGYTIEKVFFASLPGHYVSGNLYRPKGKSGKLPAVLCPHGHWANGRFYDAGEAGAKAQVAKGAEKTIEGGRYPLQARCAMLARMGCVVFHYDMVGVADSTTIGHMAGFTDAKSELWLQSFMGLQTWNSIRALDFVTSLPEVDADRIGVTGASGGGTQTFMLCAVDDRPAAVFPAVMVSTAMQGGCICENCSYLRVGTGNIEIAALFAPKPLGMSGANDWTHEIETKGLPELKALYKLYGAESNVMAECHPEFEHNYNQVSRELMYTWFNKHLKLGWPEPVVEKPFVPVPPKELSVYDAEHSRPKDEVGAEGVRKWFTVQSQQQMKSLAPTDAASLEKFDKAVRPALQAMVGGYPNKEQLVVHQGPIESKFGDYTVHRAIFGRKGEGDRIASVGLVPNCPPEQIAGIAIWIHPSGKSSLFKDGAVVPAAKALLDKKFAVMAPDVLQVGEQSAKPRPIDGRYAGYTFGYNRPLLAEQARDIVTAAALAKEMIGANKVYLVGWESMGPAAIMAKAVCGKAIDRAVADINQFRFDSIDSTSNPMMLPGALKYGGLGSFVALCAPGELFVHNQRGSGIGQFGQASYKAAGATDNLKREPEQAAADEIIGWLLR